MDLKQYSTRLAKLYNRPLAEAEADDFIPTLSQSIELEKKGLSVKSRFVLALCFFIIPGLLYLFYRACRNAYYAGQFSQPLAEPIEILKKDYLFLRAVASDQGEDSTETVVLSDSAQEKILLRGSELEQKAESMQFNLTGLAEELAPDYYNFVLNYLTILENYRIQTIRSFGAFLGSGVENEFSALDYEKFRYYYLSLNRVVRASMASENAPAVIRAKHEAIITKFKIMTTLREYQAYFSELCLSFKEPTQEAPISDALFVLKRRALENATTTNASVDQSDLGEDEKRIPVRRSTLAVLASSMDFDLTGLPGELSIQQYDSIFNYLSILNAYQLQNSGNLQNFLQIDENRLVTFNNEKFDAYFMSLNSTFQDLKASFSEPTIIKGALQKIINDFEAQCQFETCFSDLCVAFESVSQKSDYQSVCNVATGEGKQNSINKTSRVLRPRVFCNVTTVDAGADQSDLDEGQQTIPIRRSTLAVLASSMNFDLTGLPEELSLLKYQLVFDYLSLLNSRPIFEELRNFEGFLRPSPKGDTLDFLKLNYCNSELKRVGNTLAHSSKHDCSVGSHALLQIINDFKEMKSLAECFAYRRATRMERGMPVDAHQASKPSLSA